MTNNSSVIAMTTATAEQNDCCVGMNCETREIINQNYDIFVQTFIAVEFAFTLVSTQTKKIRVQWESFVPWHVHVVKNNQSINTTEKSLICTNTHRRAMDQYPVSMLRWRKIFRKLPSPTPPSLFLLYHRYLHTYDDLQLNWKGEEEAHGRWNGN